MATRPRTGSVILTGTETPDVPRDMNALGDRFETVGAIWSQGTLASRPAAASSNAGTFYHATDVGRSGIGIVYFSTGAAWIIPEPLVRAISAPQTLDAPGFAPVDGDVIEFGFQPYTDRGIYWRLRYKSTHPNRKWLAEGCAPIAGSIATASPTIVTNAVGTVVAANILTLPAPGRYRVKATCFVTQQSGAVPVAGSLGLTVAGLGQVQRGYFVLSQVTYGHTITVEEDVIATAASNVSVTGFAFNGGIYFGSSLMPIRAWAEPLELGS